MKGIGRIDTRWIGRLDLSSSGGEMGEKSEEGRKQVPLPVVGLGADSLRINSQAHSSSRLKDDSNQVESTSSGLSLLALILGLSSEAYRNLQIGAFMPVHIRFFSDLSAPEPWWERVRACHIRYAQCKL